MYMYGIMYVYSQQSGTVRLTSHGEPSLKKILSGGKPSVKKMLSDGKPSLINTSTIIIWEWR